MRIFNQAFTRGFLYERSYQWAHKKNNLRPAVLFFSSESSLPIKTPFTPKLRQTRVLSNIPATPMAIAVETKNWKMFCSFTQKGWSLQKEPSQTYNFLDAASNLCDKDPQFVHGLFYDLLIETPQCTPLQLINLIKDSHPKLMEFIVDKVIDFNVLSTSDLQEVEKSLINFSKTLPIHNLFHRLTRQHQNKFPNIEKICATSPKEYRSLYHMQEASISGACFPEVPFQSYYVSSFKFFEAPSPTFFLNLSAYLVGGPVLTIPVLATRMAQAILDKNREEIVSLLKDGWKPCWENERIVKQSAQIQGMPCGFIDALQGSEQEFISQIFNLVSYYSKENRTFLFKKLFQSTFFKRPKIARILAEQKLPVTSWSPQEKAHIEKEILPKLHKILKAPLYTHSYQDLSYLNSFLIEICKKHAE